MHTTHPARPHIGQVLLPSVSQGPLGRAWELTHHPEAEGLIPPLPPGHALAGGWGARPHGGRALASHHLARFSSVTATLLQAHLTTETRPCFGSFESKTIEQIPLNPPHP